MCVKSYSSWSLPVLQISLLGVCFHHHCRVCCLFFRACDELWCWNKHGVAIIINTSLDRQWFQQTQWMTDFCHDMEPQSNKREKLSHFHTQLAFFWLFLKDCPGTVFLKHLQCLSWQTFLNLRWLMLCHQSNHSLYHILYTLFLLGPSPMIKTFPLRDWDWKWEYIVLKP